MSKHLQNFTWLLKKCYFSLQTVSLCNENLIKFIFRLSWTNVRIVQMKWLHIYIIEACNYDWKFIESNSVHVGYISFSLEVIFSLVIFIKTLFFAILGRTFVFSAHWNENRSISNMERLDNNHFDDIWLQVVDH